MCGKASLMSFCPDNVSIQQELVSCNIYVLANVVQAKAGMKGQVETGF